MQMEVVRIVTASFFFFHKILGKAGVNTTLII